MPACQDVGHRIKTSSRLDDLHLAGLWPHIGECVQDMGEILNREILWPELASIDTPSTHISHARSVVSPSNS